jgi:hypothetical protein
MSFKSDNAAFEAWLREQCSVVEEDLEYKHRRMAKNSFVFLRATFFVGQSRSRRYVLN